MVALAEKGDLRQNMVALTERWTRDVLTVPILRALEVLHNKVCRSSAMIHSYKGTCVFPLYLPFVLP